MSSRLFVCLLLAIPAWSVAQSGPAVPDEPAQGGKPNIVLVFMDNFGWGDQGSTHGRGVRAPGVPDSRYPGPS
jgi:hypothetical protein